MRRRILALGAVLVMLGAGCGAGRHAAATTTTTTVAGPNPDVVPPVITPAYVDAVFAVLNRIYGNAVRDMITADAVTSTALSDLRAIFDDPLYAKEVGIAHDSLTPENLSNVRHPPGDVRTSVVRLVSASATCVFVQTTDDYSSVLVHPGPAPAVGYWGLERKQPGHDPLHLNPTPWAFFFNGVFTSPTSIPNQCGT